MGPPIMFAVNFAKNISVCLKNKRDSRPIDNGREYSKNIIINRP